MGTLIPVLEPEELAWQHFHNPRTDAGQPYPSELQKILNYRDFAAAKAVIEALPLYSQTPTHRMHGLAAALGIAELYVKDESTRFGLGTFKGVGGAYAVYCLLKARAERLGVGVCSAQDFLDHKHPGVSAGLTVVCATTGNHGRSVARAAQMFGCRCVIYVPAAMSRGRITALEALGARIVRPPGSTYDSVVKQAESDARLNGWSVISDTAYEGQVDTPRDVMHGYRVIVDEVVQQVSTAPPTHVFVQTGVGGIAASFASHFWEVWGNKRPRFVVVESKEAACMLQSAQADHPVTIEGEFSTRMAGLAAGEPSTLAWQILRVGADDFVTIADAPALLAMRLLASRFDGDPPVVSGEAGGAGLGSLIVALSQGATRDALGLNRSTRALVIVTEGATDPEAYQSIVGRAAAQVLGDRSPSPSPDE